VTTTPGGSPDGVTVTSVDGGQLPGVSDAVIVREAPPALSTRGEGATDAAKLGGRTWATNVVVASIPRGSETFAVIVRLPAARPAAAVSVNETTRVGGTLGTSIVAGVAVKPAGSPGNETVGVPV
jgi:hypothetical protein